MEIESVEIIKGPASVYYGLHSEGGTIAYQTIKFGDFTRLRLLYGSDNSKEANAVLARTHGKFGQVYSFQYYQTEGWRDNSDGSKYNISGRWSYQFTDSWVATLNVRAFRSEWNQPINGPSYLPKHASMDDGSGQYPGGVRDRMDFRFWTNYMLGDTSQFTLYAYYVDMDINLYGKSWSWNIAQGAANGSEEGNTHRAFGTGLMYNYMDDWNGHAVSATLGLDYLRENERRDRWGLMWGRGRARNPNPATHSRDHEYTLETLSLFGELNYQIIDPLRARFGIRYDRFGGHIVSGPDQQTSGTSTILGPNQNIEAKERSVISPKFGLHYTTPIEWLEIYGNYSRGFGLPYMETGTFFVDPNSEMTKRDQFEIGFRASPTDWLSIESVYYLLKTKNDIIFSRDVNGQVVHENGGETKRYGIETSIAIVPFENFRISGNFTYQIAKYTRNINRATNIDLSGRRFANHPSQVTNIEVAYQPPRGFGARLSFNWNADSLNADQPPLLMNGQPNPGVSGNYKRNDYGTLDGQISYTVNEQYRFFVDAVNILDKQFTVNGSNLSIITNDPSHPEGYYVTSWMQPLTIWAGFEANW
jgi:iron complex outermembrane receptor protein